MRIEGLFFITRNTPKRSVIGGSIYWVIKGFIRVRQRIIGFEQLIEVETPLRDMLGSSINKRY